MYQNKKFKQKARRQYGFNFVNGFHCSLYQIEIESASESNGVISFSHRHLVWLQSVKTISARITSGDDTAKIVRNGKKTSETLTKSHKKAQ